MNTTTGNSNTTNDPTRFNFKSSASSSNLNLNIINHSGLDGSSNVAKNERQLDCSKSIDSIENVCNDGEGGVGEEKKPIKRNTSLISFKSLDFNLKTIYSSMKSKHGRDASGGGSKNGTASSSKTSITKPPYLRVETVDTDESENLLTFPQSPYAQHRGSFDKSGYQYLSTQADYSRSQTSSPSPFLSISTPPNIRRSSTSDIIDKNHPAQGSSSQTDNRRPSTSDLLRRARERKGSEGAKMGRSISQGGMPRGGRAGRRTSMAF